MPSRLIIDGRVLFEPQRNGDDESKTQIAKSDQQISGIKTELAEPGIVFSTGGV
jgi:hypothetical protein